MEYDIGKVIEEITSLANPPPFCIEQPVTLEAAKYIFDKLKSRKIFPDSNLVYSLLLQNGWQDTQAKRFIKKLKKYFK